MNRAAAPLAVLVIALALGACGSEARPASDPTPRPVETSDRLPRLAPGWRPFVNPFGGYAFGLPPGWEARRRGTATSVSYFDRLAQLSISADRTRDAVELPLADFASRVIAARTGYEEALEPGEPRRLEHRYPAVVVAAEGEATSGGVRQTVEVIVLRRPKLVTLTIVIAVSAIPEAERSARIAERIVKTMRTRPTGPGI